MVNNAFKTFTITDGVRSPTLLSVKYPISYVDASPNNYIIECKKVVRYSDGSSYIAVTAQVKTRLADKLTINGSIKQQFSFADVDEQDTFGQHQIVFPYIVLNNALPVVVYTQGQTQVQTWSDGRTYSKFVL